MDARTIGKKKRFIRAVGTNNFVLFAKMAIQAILGTLTTGTVVEKNSSIRARRALHSFSCPAAFKAMRWTPLANIIVIQSKVCCAFKAPEFPIAISSTLKAI